MTSEGIHLNVGGGDVEGVTCTVIEGMSYHQMCQSEAIVQNSISHTDTMTGMTELHCALIILKAAYQFWHVRNSTTV